MESLAGSGLEEHDGVVASELVLERRAHAGEELVGVAGPVRGAVDGSAVAQEHALRMDLRLDVLQVALDVEDRGLRGAHRAFGSRSRKAAREEDRRGLRHEGDPVAELAAKQVGGRRLAAARAARQHDSTPRAHAPTPRG